MISKIKLADGLHKIVIITVLSMSIGLLAGCGQNTVNNSKENAGSELDTATSNESDDKNTASEIKIVYTNDVHSYINNVVKDDNGNITGEGLRFSKIAAMVSDMKKAGDNVLLVDAGDEIQGDIYGAMDEGQTVIDIMGATGYQLATPGNHDFDYGVTQFFKLAENAKYPYVTCNFHSTKGTETILEDAHIFNIAGKKVAFVGVTTPEVITSSTPVYFQDEKGEFIYTIDGLQNPDDLYSSVQNTIDKVKEDADYVIGIGHVGIGMDSVKKGWDSMSLIENVSGLNAFIDGHSHTTIEGDIIKDKDGKDVILTQTGCYLSAVGIMTISSDGTINTELVNDYDRVDETVAGLEQNWIESINSKMNEKIGVLENTLCINNPDNDKQRLIRSRELNLGDFTADSVYWFFNDRLGINCDVAIQNGGGIRSAVEKGDLTFLSAKQVEPFGNMICIISATGQQILDCLEMGATEIGEWDEEWDCPAENGAFIQVAGMKYTIDSTVQSSVKTDSNNMFEKVDGDYRVKDVMIYNRESGGYEPIDLDREYQLAGINYILRNNGNGMTMFDSDELTVDYVGLDYVVLSEYIKSFGAESGFPVINTENSPLAAYDGYLIDYENPYGAGRINIILE